MKSSFFFLSSILCLTLCAGCSSDAVEALEEPAPVEEAQDSVFTYDMNLDSAKPSYDDEASTRATDAGVWEDGDIIFLCFSNSGSNAYAKGVYHKSSGKWTITCDKNLTEVSNARCYVYYAKGVNPVEYTDYISFDYCTAAFAATSSSTDKYSFSGGVISVTATLKKRGWRMRFKGTAGTNIALWSGRSFYTYYLYGSTYELNYNSHVTRTLTVGSNGYTDYIVCYEPKSSCTNIVITNTVTGDTYYRYFDGNTVKDGNSYYYTIPTSSNLHGWTKSNVASGTVGGYEYVDLGLPSGKKWARFNLGASSETGFGNYYAWGETSPKDSYTSGTYTYSGTSNLSGSSDAAYVNWGSSWCMPSTSDCNELLNNCSYASLSLNGVLGYCYVGKNGRSIFLPNAGYYNGSSKRNSMGYWTSTVVDSSYARYFYGYNTSSEYRGYGFPIRPVVAQ